MSSERNAEVVGCSASIVKNVWEYREREYGQKLKQEQDRVEKSALTIINKDWENRLNVRHGTGKRVERKPKVAEDPADSNNVWKSKQPQRPPSLPRGLGSGAVSKPIGSRGGFSSPVPHLKDKKGQGKSLNRLELLMFITQTQPSPMVWGKSWKYHKYMPEPEEGAAVSSNWGKCWMFATHQPHTEAGQPWLNGPNVTDPCSLHLWNKPDHRVVETQELDLCLSTNEWQTSWEKVKSNKKEDSSKESEGNIHKYGIFTSLVESQHHNEVLCSSEWSDSWTSTKPSSEQQSFMPLDVGHDQMQDKDMEMTSEWEECWRLANHHGSNSKLPKIKKSNSSEWCESWRAAAVVLNHHKNSDHSIMTDHTDSFKNHKQHNNSHLHEIMAFPNELKYRDLHLQLCHELNGFSEWTKSWQVTKNNSKPCEEMEKILKLSVSRMRASMEAQKVENNTKGNHSAPEKADSFFEQQKHNVLYSRKREFTQSFQLYLNHQKNDMSESEWKESWKTLKHRMRMERRRTPHASMFFRTNEKEGDMKVTAPEWKDSWKCTCRPLQQDPELWQQGWSTMPQFRVDRARDENHFRPIQLPKNGPTSERSWGESWRFSMPCHRSDDGQSRAHVDQGRSSTTSHCSSSSQTHNSVKSTGLISDWQDAWMISETQFRHDKPSFTQWREAWKSSLFTTQHWIEQLSTENGMNALMQIQPQRKKISLQAAKDRMSQSFDQQMFRKIYPEQEWSASWRAGLVANYQQSHAKSAEMSGKAMSSNNQQGHVTTNGHGSKWGISFRLANPMPQTEQPWVESSPNPYNYEVMWSRAKNIHISDINTSFGSNLVTFKIWGTAHQFLQRSSAQHKSKTKSKDSADPRVIVTKKNKTRKHLYAPLEEKQSERKWAGCHLLGKTQPRPKRGPASVNKSNREEDNTDKFFEEWAESWRFLVQPGSQKKQMSVKSFSGWNDSWKFLLSPYQPVNGPKVR